MQFNREERYYVLKISDMRKYLSIDKQEVVRSIAEKLHAGRIVDKKKVLQAVVVESDWPEYDAVWQMIEARMTDASKLKGPAGEEFAGPADTVSNRHAISKDPGSAIAIMQRMQRHINELTDRERGMLDAEAELNCAEEVLDGYAARLDLKETHFDCVGDYIKEVCEALKAAPPKELGQEPDDLTIAYMVGLSRGKDIARRKPLVDEPNPTSNHHQQIPKRSPEDLTDAEASQLNAELRVLDAEFLKKLEQRHGR